MNILSLFDYEQRWLDDASRFKVACKSRQIGYTWTETLDIVNLLLLEPKTPWYFLSISEDRAAEAVDYAVDHALAMGAALGKRGINDGFFEDTDYKFKKLTLSNGSFMLGLPANPRTARGVSGHLTLDEYAHQQHADEIWRAAVPAALTWGWKVRVISTPNGKQGRYHQLWTHNGQRSVEEIAEELGEGKQPCSDLWSRHWADIAMAVRDGHPIDLVAARAIAGDELTWQQEYCCAFLDEALAWIPFDLMQKNTHRSATVQLGTELPEGALVGGYDVGRKRDLASLWINEVRDGHLHTCKHVEVFKNVPFAEQKTRIDAYMPRLSALGVDAIGIGAQLAEDLQHTWGESVIKAYSGGTGERAKMATRVRTMLERGQLRLPHDQDVRSDFNSVQRKYTSAGNVSFQAPHRADGHADRFWACAFALEAAGETKRMAYESVGDRPAWGTQQYRGWRDDKPSEHRRGRLYNDDGRRIR